MEESLDNINKTLICKRDKIRERLFSIFKCCMDCNKITKKESEILNLASLLFHDNEFDMILEEYEKLKNLTFTIDNFLKNKQD